ncbi:ABC-2 type transport system ATP-binding protein [Proteiniborus ethanoligenes]|uniref:ABC-2 type transport system ATP-binding protein n=1 Tax=Proteiniborus ethanoligenes TaxID=415015 RepID=A0A1H3NSA6_9FIRM|nr:ATP-binding cassette domain-containing protein [Proteiniborus ethanoligenes]SDY91633.1 ABC-2 type transport system ATP-binding protein [Proteiniborus ethanoligenes]
MEFITVKGLKKDYIVYEKKNLFRRNKRKIEALKEIDFTVKKGEFLGYVGPNGAGKSTTIKILTGIMTPSDGIVKVDGYIPYRDRKKYVRNIGVVFGQKTQMWWDLPVIDTYELLRGIYKVDEKKYKKQLEYLVDKLFLQDILKQPVRQLSLGQRMRAELGACMIHDPDILFLDEPTIGLDVVSKHRVVDFLQEINKKGKTIFLTTHDMKDIEKLCNEMLVLNHGDIVYKGKVEELKTIGKLPIKIVAQMKRNGYNDLFMEIISQHSGTYDDQKSQLVLNLKNKKEISEIAKILFNNFDIDDFSVQEPSIEEVIKTIYTS